MLDFFRGAADPTAIGARASCPDLVLGAVALAALVVGCAAAPRGDGHAELARARTAAARGETLRAIELYEAVPRFSKAWPRALFEASVERARKLHHSRALGMLFTFRAPQLRAWVYPEAFALEARIYLDHCFYRRAEAIATEFRTDVLPLRAAIQRSHADPRLATRLAEDGTLDRLRDELDAAEAALDQIVELARRRRTAIVDNDDDDTDRGRLPPITVIANDAHRWNFDGTFWPDELGRYAIALHSRCRLRKHARTATPL
jgi:hypothetical protein